MQVTQKMVVARLEFNTVAPALFDVRLAENTRVADDVRNIQYTVEKAGVPFAQAFDFARLRIDAKQKWGGGVFWLVLLNLLAITAVSLAAALRWRKARTKAMSDSSK